MALASFERTAKYSVRKVRKLAKLPVGDIVHVSKSV
jgi:hypothetical protein